MSSHLQRLFALVLSVPSLPVDIQAELSLWDDAGDRGDVSIRDMDAWAERIATSIEALGHRVSPNVVVVFQEAG